MVEHRHQHSGETLGISRKPSLIETLSAALSLDGFVERMASNPAVLPGVCPQAPRDVLGTLKT
jgi:hypothetical protein